MDVFIGPHRVVREAEDIFAVTFGANITEKEMLAIFDIFYEHAANGRWFLVIDFSRIAAIPAPVRRIVGEAGKRLKWRAVAMYGASIQMRVLATLVNNALAILSRSPFPQKFFDSREAALRWCDELRARQDAESA
jgi:hypothetical protein